MMVKSSTTLTLLMMISATLGQQVEVVNTTLGPIQGLRKTVQGKVVDVYYGIPFARPPLGELRFKRPQPAEPWTDVLSTVTKPNTCLQTISTADENFPGAEKWKPSTPLSEDCLYLNVWVPRGSQPPNTTMVWIYGGGFVGGTSMLDAYDGSKLAASQNVIVASMNYRIGPLGFLYTGTMDAPGNQGLLDQSLALKWIYDNVANFGGRQDSITIFGESAGAISVGYHLLSNVSMNYFTRAIMQSGSPLMEMTFMSQQLAGTRATNLAEMFSCPVNSIAHMIQCLQNVSAENITSAQWRLSTPGMFLDVPTRVVVDGYFLTEEADELVAKGAVKDTELLIGANKDEGVYFLITGLPHFFPLNNSGAITDAEFKNLVHVFNNKGSEAVDKAVISEYVDRVVQDKRDSYRDVADDIVGDQHFSCPAVDFANALASMDGRRDVYLYSFQQRLSNNPWPEWTGVMHGSEIEVVFGLPLDHNYTEEDRNLTNRMMGYWTRFAQYGQPTESNALWPKLTSQKAQYLTLTAQGDYVGQGLRHEQCTFRSTVLPLLQQGPSTECPRCPTAGQGMLAPTFLHLTLLHTVTASLCFILAT